MFHYIIKALKSRVTYIVNTVKPVAGPSPTGCNGVQALGWTQSGYYTVKGSTNKLNTVYCDFTKSTGSIGSLMLLLNHLKILFITYQIDLNFNRF